MFTPFHLTGLGVFHTLLSIVCVVAAFVALFRDRRISPATGAGRFYLWTLVITTLTGFPIFRTGHAGPPHVLGVVILVVLALAVLAEKTSLFGRAGAHVSALSYSFTVFLLMIPTFTETLTRVPPGAPVVAGGPEAPIFPPLYSVLFVLFLAGAALQLRAMRAAAGSRGTPQKTAA